MYESRPDDAGRDPPGSEPAAGHTDAHGGGKPREATVVERLSRYGMQVMPSAFQRRSRLQRRLEVTDGPAPGGLQREASERGSLTPAARKKHLKELLLSNPTPSSASSEQIGGCALSPMEHAWMLCAVEGSYEDLLEFISEDPCLLTRMDFISGYSVLHWLAKRGRGETLLQLMRHAEGAGIPVNVNARGSGGLTPLHVASMHAQYMVIKLLVGALGADVDAMDYNGRRAWQYLQGDAPREMRELLGTWDDEHCDGCAPNGRQNVNNNSAGVMNLAVDEVDHGAPEAVGSLARTRRGGSGRFGFLNKLRSSFSFFGNS
ncbi:ankyrin repeat domain-containing protein SOWAHD [Pungitius pungitius]|uniref:ankyrin repeat domain-containing protein SOWAHD n=1 Tax=Pungitius pungitius TaxID=134920 RepID=UPI002E0DEFEC